MFDSFKNMADLPRMMAAAKGFQENMKRVQEQMAREEFAAEAGGGLVRATVNGQLDLVRIRIDRTRLGVAEETGKVPVGQSDLDMLEDLVVAAVQAAQFRAKERLQFEMKRLAEEAGLPPGALPGLGQS